eukprot:g11823.t1
MADAIAFAAGPVEVGSRAAKLSASFGGSLCRFVFRRRCLLLRDRHTGWHHWLNAKIKGGAGILHCLQLAFCSLCLRDPRHGKTSFGLISSMVGRM